MSCYEKRGITFVFKNCSFQAWNIFLIFLFKSTCTDFSGSVYSQGLWPQAALLGYWSKDKTTLHEIKIKARTCTCQIAIYNLLDAREGSTCSFCAKQSSKKAPSEEPQRAVTPNCRAIALFSKRRVNHKYLQQLYTGATATTLSLPSATWCRAAQEKEWSSISSQIQSGSQGPLCCQPIRPKRRSGPLLSNPGPTAAHRGLAPGGLSMEGWRHTRITTHSFALRLGTILESWLHCLPLENSHLW